MDINKYHPKQLLKTKTLTGASRTDESDIYEILWHARLVKNQSEAGEEHDFLEQKTVAVIYDGELPFFAAMLDDAVFDAGGKVLYLHKNRLRKNLRYASLALQSSGVCAFVFFNIDEPFLEKFQKQSDAVVINAGNYDCNIVQAMADLFTLWETKKRLNGLKIVLSKTARSENINSFVLSAVKCGCEITICQNTDAIDGHVTERALQYGEFNFTDTVEKAADADAIYCDFGADFDSQSLEQALEALNDEGVLVCSRPENAPETLNAQLEKHDPSIILGQSNIMHVIKAILSLIV